MIVAGTGHRPKDTDGELSVRFRVNKVFEEKRPKVFISGMADGFDLWAAAVAVELGIAVWAAIPFAGQKNYTEQPDLYNEVIAAAAQIHMLNPAEEWPKGAVFFYRNHWMVDHATHVLAYWNGKASGGTYETRNYAIKKDVPVKNIYEYPPF